MKPESIESGGSATTDKNVMPSMVVRQQRIQMGIGSAINQRGPARRPGEEAPAPSCSIMSANELLLGAQVQQQHQQGQQQFDQDGLVLPKRLVHHPVSVGQPIIRDLNRELKFNQIRGKNVLDQKSELKKALEKLEESKRRREAEQERLNRRTSLELRLEERAERIAKESQTEEEQQQQQAGEQAATCKPLSNFLIKPISR